MLASSSFAPQLRANHTACLRPKQRHHRHVASLSRDCPSQEPHSGVCASSPQPGPTDQAGAMTPGHVVSAHAVLSSHAEARHWWDTRRQPVRVCTACGTCRTRHACMQAGRCLRCPACMPRTHTRGTTASCIISHDGKHIGRCVHVVIRPWPSVPCGCEPGSIPSSSTSVAIHPTLLPGSGPSCWPTPSPHLHGVPPLFHRPL